MISSLSLIHICNGEIDPVKIAVIGQYAENVYFGKPSGLMDQTASSVGGIVAIDFENTENPVVRKLDFDFTKTGYSLCIIDSGADHADLTGEYAAIPAEMKKAANAVGKEFLRETTMDEIFAHMPEVRKAAGDLSLIHIYSPGRRYKVLDILNIYEINMIKIESRPAKHKLGTYVFYIDLVAENDEDLKDAVKMIKRKVAFFKFLGSYSTIE